MTAAAERGNANAAVETLLAEVLALPKSAVQVVSGQTSKTKRLEITGIDDAELRRRLAVVLR